MKPRAFKYLAPRSVAEVYEQLAEHGDEARILAGGQSLVPMMTLRMASPEVLIDINNLEELGGINSGAREIRIGALTRHCEVEHSALIHSAVPLLASALPHVAHIAIRNRGTFGGSVSLADPAAELPACSLLLSADFEIGSCDGTRRVAATDFFRGIYETALAPGELLLAGVFSRAEISARFAFREFSRRKGDFALAGIAAAAQGEGRNLTALRLVGFGIAETPVLLPTAADVLLQAGDRTPDIGLLKEALAADAPPAPDVHYSAGFRLHLTATLVARCLADLVNNEKT